MESYQEEKGILGENMQAQVIPQDEKDDTKKKSKSFLPDMSLYEVSQNKL